MIIKEYESQTGLPKQVESLCPECCKIIDAQLVDRDGRVMMEKECPEHGTFEDTVFSDTDLYLRMEPYAHDGVGVHNPMNPEAEECPTD